MDSHENCCMEAQNIKTITVSSIWGSFFIKRWRLVEKNYDIDSAGRIRRYSSNHEVYR